MRATPNALVAFLAARPQNFLQVNFFEFVLQNGLTFRYCTYPKEITIPALPPRGGVSALTVTPIPAQALSFGGAFSVDFIFVTVPFVDGTNLVAITTTPGNALGHITIGPITDPEGLVAWSARSTFLLTAGNLTLTVFEGIAIGVDVPPFTTMKIQCGSIIGRLSLVGYGIGQQGGGPVLFDSDPSLPAAGGSGGAAITSLGSISTVSTDPLFVSFVGQPQFIGDIPLSDELWSRQSGVFNTVPNAPDPGIEQTVAGTYLAMDSGLSVATVKPWQDNPPSSSSIFENALYIDAFANSSAPPVLTPTTWIGNDVQITSGGGGKSASFDTPAWSSKLGGTADQMEINASYFPSPLLPQDGPQSLIGSTAWPIAIRQGMLDNAKFTMYTAFWASLTDLLSQHVPIGYGDIDQFGNQSTGLLNMFSGFVSAISQVDRQSAKITVRDGRVVLDQNFPRDVFQATCIHALYDEGISIAGKGCTLLAASFSATGTMGAPTSTTFTYTSAQAAGYYQLGKVVYVDPVTGQPVTIQISNDTGTVITVSSPFPTIPAAGTAFTIYAGCDKTRATCINKFNNLIHFLGFPFAPPPRTTI